MATEVGSAYLRIIPSTQGFAASLRGQTAVAAAPAGKAGGKALGAGLLAGASRVVAPLAAVFAGAKVFGFAKDAVGEASGLNESINALNVTYGKASKGVQQLGKESATSLGLSNLEFNNLAVRFSNFASTVAKAGGGSVVGTLDDLTTRASDFASVMNLEVNEAAQLFQSGLAGESEPLRRFGIDMSAAAVSAFAYSEGIAESGATLTEQQKVQSRYGLLMQQTAKTQGDFANTSGELANQQRILGARFDNLKATLGTALLPVITTVVSKVNEFIGSFSGLIERAGGVGAALKSAFGGGEGGGPLSGLVSAFQSAMPTLKSIFGTVVSIVRTAMQVVVEVIRRVTSVIQFVWRNWGTQITGVVKGVFGFVVGIIKGALKIIEGIWKAALALLKGDWKGAWEAIKSALRGAATAIIGAIKSLASGIKSLIDGLASALGRLWSNIWRAALNAFTTGATAVVNFVRGIPGRIVAALGNLGSLLVNAGGQLIQGLITGITGAVGRAVEAVRNAVGNVVAGAKRALGIASPSKVFMQIGQQTAEGMALGISAGAGDIAKASQSLVPARPAVVGAGSGATARPGATFNILSTTEEQLARIRAAQRREALRARLA